MEWLRTTIAIYCFLWFLWVRDPGRDRGDGCSLLHDAGGLSRQLKGWGRNHCKFNSPRPPPAVKAGVIWGLAGL